MVLDVLLRFRFSKVAALTPWEVQRKVVEDLDNYWCIPGDGLVAVCLYCHLHKGKQFTISSDGAGARLHRTESKTHRRLVCAMECEITTSSPDVGETDPSADQLNEEGMFLLLKFSFSVFSFA